MLDSYTRENARDFGSRYNQTYCFYKYPDEDRKKLVYIREVGDREISFMDADRGEYSAARDSGVTFEFTQMPLGWYSGEENIYLFARHAGRQWKRGICEGNTRVFFLDSRGNLNQGNISFEVLSAAVKEKEVAYTDGSFVLSRNFALSPTRCYFNDRVIGSRSGRSVVLSSSLCKQEIQDLSNRHNLGLKIEVK